MMKHWKKGILALLVCAVAAGGFTACGDQNNASGVTNVSVWTNSTSTKDLAEQLIADYNENEGKQKGIKIEYKIFGSDYQNILDVAIQSQDLPDMFNPISNIKDMVIKNALMPLEDMPGGTEFVEPYKNQLIPMRNTYMGKTYCVPYKMTTIGLIYNKDLFVKNGIVDEKGEAKPPKTWDEVAEYAKICTDKQNNIYGIALPLKWGGYTNWELIQPFFTSLGTAGYDYENECFDYTKLAPAFEWLLKIKSDESYFIGAEGLDNDPARSRFAEGYVAMKLGASWDVGVLNDQYTASCDWGVAEIPSLGDAPAYKQWSSVDPILAISSSIKENEKEKVMQAFAWFHNDDNRREMYRQGKYIPSNSSIIAGEQVEYSAKNWAEFAQLAEQSVAVPQAPVVSIEGDTLSKVMLKIWMGDVDIQSGLEDLTKRSNEALEKEKARGTLGDMSNYKWGDINYKRN